MKPLDRDTIEIIQQLRDIKVLLRELIGEVKKSRSISPTGDIPRVGRQQ